MRSHARAASAGSTEGNGAGRGLIRRGVAALAGAGSLALVVALIAVPAAAAAPWGFEQVTPPVKGAGSVASVDTFRASPDGDSFLYSASSPFSSVPAESSPLYTRYLGTRGPTSWSNLAVDPRYAPAGSLAPPAIMTVVASSTDLSHVLVASTVAQAPGATEEGGNLYVRDTATGELTLVATSSDPILATQFTSPQGQLNAKYISSDGRSVLFTSMVPPMSGVPSEITGLYSWTAAGGLQIESVLPADEGAEMVSSGSVNSSEEGTRSSVPESGGLDHVYFSAFSNSGPGAAYVRTAGVTKAVSVSHIAGDPTTPVPAQVDAVSADGRYMIFHANPGGQAAIVRLTPDTPEDPTVQSIVYRYDVSDGSLTYIGALGANNDQVIQMSQDGQTVAFQSVVALTAGASYGAPNLYVWRDGDLQLVETAEPGSSTTYSRYLRVLSHNGRYFSFTDNSISTAQSFGQDNVSESCPPSFSEGPGPCEEVYLYDTETEALSCVSCLPGGAPPRGDAGATGIEGAGYIRMDSHQMQTVADDGTVFFTSPDDLVAADTNGRNDVYSSYQGQLRLLSRGSQGADARFLDATPDGKTVFIATNDAIVPTDTDRAIDVYMTREGAGYPYTPPPVPPVCAGIESCHAGVAATPTQFSPGSASFEGRGNENPRSRKSGGKLTVAKPRAAVGSSGALQVKAPGKGRLTVTGPGVKKATKTVAKTGTYTVKVTLTPGAHKALEKSGQTQKTLKVTFKPSQGKASSATVKLTFKASAGKKGGRQS